MRDEKGADFKILCVAEGDPHQTPCRAAGAGPSASARRDRALLPDVQAARGRTVEGFNGWRDAGSGVESCRHVAEPGWLAGFPGVESRRRRRTPLEAGSTSPGRCGSSSPCRSPADARGRVGELMEHVQQGVGDGRARIRWVRVDGLHLTLRFLGPTMATMVPALQAGADALARADAPFEVRLSGGGAFPSLARPRSLWIGVYEGAERLAALADGLTATAADCGLFLDTRPFAAHLTIARTDGVRLAPAAAHALEAAADGLDARLAWTGSSCSGASSVAGLPATRHSTSRRSGAEGGVGRRPAALRSNPTGG